MNIIIYSIVSAITLYFLTSFLIKKYPDKIPQNKFTELLRTLTNNNTEALLLIVGLVSISLYMGELLNNGLLYKISNGIQTLFSSNCSMNSFIPNFGTNKVIFMKSYPRELM
jgi:hypothetical protein